MQITEHFSYEEMTHSTWAEKHRVKNDIPSRLMPNMEALCREVLEPLRSAWDAPLRVTSGYRNAVVNRSVGGVMNSQHLTGEAADITTGSPTRNRYLLELIRHLAASGDLEFDQCIAEHTDDWGAPLWIHISHRASGHNRKQMLEL